MCLHNRAKVCDREIVRVVLTVFVVVFFRMLVLPLVPALAPTLEVSGIFLFLVQSLLMWAFFLLAASGFLGHLLEL